MFAFWIALGPVLGGALFSIMSAGACLVFMRRPLARQEDLTAPPVALLKPVYGLEKGLRQRLATACEQDYPAYRVIFCVQRPDDPALPVVRELADRYGAARVALVLHDTQLGPNGKVNNLAGGLAVAGHEILVISDSDVTLPACYLRTIVAPFADPRVGSVNTLFKMAGASNWYDQLELLTINADFIPSVIFNHLLQITGFGLGPTLAIRCRTLERIGGLPALAEYLAEDYEIGRRVIAAGERHALLPFVVDAKLDLSSAREWWRHQIYWDQNTRAAEPVGFSLTILTRSVPFAIIACVASGFGAIGIQVLIAAVIIRLATAAFALRALGDAEGLRSLPWLPLRDCVGLVTWFLAFTDRTVSWRGVEYSLTEGGRMVRKAG